MAVARIAPEHEALLRQVEGWHEALARDLAPRNPGLGELALDRAARAIACRLLFLHLLDGAQDGRGRSSLRARLLQPGPAPWGLPAAADPSLLSELEGQLDGASGLPAGLLAQAYERLLGCAIRLAPGRRVVPFASPEARRAGGAYYTPDPIVDYAVEHTLGRLGPGRASYPRILDPACGGGSFLVGAYRRLLAARLAQGPGAHPEELAPGADGAPQLRVAARARILLRSVRGVDVDPQAVEVARLSLLLALLEGQGALPATALEHVLTELAANVVYGDALEGAGGASSVGGYDVLIGNPPYLFGERRASQPFAAHRARFALARGQYDACWLFIELGLRLTAPGGRLALVAPDALLARDEAREVRRLLLERGLERVYHCGPVFRAGVSCVVLVVAMGARPEAIVSEVRRGGRAVVEHTCRRERFEADPARRLLVHATDAEAALLARMADAPRLGSMVAVSRGEETGKARIARMGPIPALAGEDIGRYALRAPTRYLDGLAKGRAHYRAPKIVVVKTGARCVAALDEQGLATLQSVYNLHVTDPGLPPEAVLGLLNSRAVRFYVAKTFTAYKLLFPQLNQTTLRAIPLPPALVDGAGALAAAVRRLLALQRDLAAADDSRRRAIQGKIDAADRAVDRLVYQLYGLAAPDIALIESSSA